MPGAAWLEVVRAIRSGRMKRPPTAIVVAIIGVLGVVASSLITARCVADKTPTAETSVGSSLKFDQHGDHNTQTNRVDLNGPVSVGPPPRHLTQQSQETLARIPRDARIDVSVPMGGTGEEWQFANEILAYLKSSGYSRAEGVSQAVVTPPVVGQIIHPEADGSFSVWVGSQN